MSPHVSACDLDHHQVAHMHFLWITGSILSVGLSIGFDCVKLIVCSTYLNYVCVSYTSVTVKL
jgi:hypothetical protein